MNEDGDEERPQRLRLSGLNNFVLSRKTFILQARPVLSRLPANVWSLILSHFLNISKQEIMKNSGFAMAIPRVYRERFDVLRALSQTCRILRALYLPLAWEHVEACIWSDQDFPVDHYLSYILKRQCHGLLKYPELASHVKTMSISVLYWPDQPILRQLARCLGSLSNLCTLQIVSCTFQCVELEKVFRNKTYPSIKNIVLPANAYPIIQCCLAIQNIHVIPCHNDNPRSCWHHLMLGIAANCPYVEAITGLEVFERDVIRRGTQGSPYAERIKELLAS